MVGIYAEEKFGTQGLLFREIILCGNPFAITPMYWMQLLVHRT